MLLLTGATGFLGRTLAPRLAEAGYPVRALVRTGSEVTFLRRLGVELVMIDDISQGDAVAAACQGCRHVVHAAGLFRFWGDLPSFWQTNVGGTAAVLAGAAQAGVERLIHLSTIAVVGRPRSGRVIDERYPPQPQDYYQRTKLEAERLALAYSRAGRLSVVVLRPGAFYGPWGRYAFNRLFFEEPLRGWRIKVDNGRHVTFPCYVEDVAQGVRLALQNGRPGEIYNISGPSLDHNSINAIVSQLAGISRWRLNVPSQAMVALARAWTWFARYTGREPFYPINMAPYVFGDWHVSSDKARVELGFCPTPFTVGVQATLAWYRQIGLGR